MTRTQLQNIVNENRFNMTRVSRLYTCSACYHMATIDGHPCIVLQSYSTLVSVYDCSTFTLYKFGYYSATTSQHNSKFSKMLTRNTAHITKEVNLYADSRTSKKKARADEECDYETSINW